MAGAVRRAAGMLRRNWAWWLVPLLATLAAIAAAALLSPRRDAVRAMYDFPGEAR
jgi:hypothetical protein